MSAPLGNVPFTATVSQAPFVEIRTWVGAVLGAVGVDGDVVVAGGAGVVRGAGLVVDGLGGTEGAGVVFGTGVSPTATGFEGVGVVMVPVGLVVAVAAGTTSAGDAGRDGVAASCWTNGSLVPKSPNETSWSALRWTTMRSVSGNFQPDDGGADPATLDDVVA